MTKKVWLVLLAVVLVLGLGLLGCKGDGSPAGEEEEESEYTLKIGKNEWSNDKENKKGNQAKLSFSKLGLGIPSLNDTFTLSFVGVPDETGEKKDGVALSIALVDTSEAASWWKVIGEWNAEVIGNDTAYANIADVTAGTEITFTGTLTVKEAPVASSPSDVNLVFAMEAQPWAKPVTLQCTSFSFKKN